MSSASLSVAAAAAPGWASTANGTRARARTSRRSHRLVRMRSPKRPPPSSATRGAMASATVFTRLAPMASRQSTCRCTTTPPALQRAGRRGRRRRRRCARPGCAARRRGPPAGAPPPQASSRISCWCARSRSTRGRHVGHADDLHLGGHHRLVGLGLEAAPAAHHARGVRGGGDHRRLLDRHRHQVVPAVDQEVEPQPQRQGVDADGVLHQPSASPAAQAAAVQHRQLVRRQRHPGQQLIAPRAKRQAIEAGDPGVHLGHRGFSILFERFDATGQAAVRPGCTQADV